MEIILEKAVPLGIMLLCVGTLLFILIWLINSIRRYIVGIKMDLDSIIVMYAKELGMPIIVDGEVIENPDDLFNDSNEEGDAPED